MLIEIDNAVPKTPTTIKAQGQREIHQGLLTRSNCACRRFGSQLERFRWSDGSGRQDADKERYPGPGDFAKNCRGDQYVLSYKIQVLGSLQICGRTSLETSSVMNTLTQKFL